MDKFCPNFSKYLVKVTDGKALVTRLRCKQWSCDYCAALNRKNWRKRIREAVDKLPEGYIWQFWTLTAHENIRGTVASYNNVSQSWVKIYDDLKRLYRRENCDLRYIRVVEPHKDGSIHFHLLVGIKIDYKTQDIKLAPKPQYTPTGRLKKAKQIHPTPRPEFIPFQRWLKNTNRRNGAGFMCEISDITGGNKHVVNYVTKYITKTEFEIPKHVRRIQPSLKWVRPEREHISSGWTIYDRITISDVLRFAGDNVVLYDVQNKQNITSDDFNRGDNFR